MLAVAQPDDNEADWVRRALALTSRALEAQFADSISGYAPPTAERARELEACHAVHRLTVFLDDQSLRLVCDGLATLRASAPATPSSSTCGQGRTRAGTRAPSPQSSAASCFSDTAAHA